MISNEQIICSYIKEIKHHLPIYKSEEKNLLMICKMPLWTFQMKPKNLHTMN